MSSYFETPIEFLKGVGPQRAALLQKELNIFTFGDLVGHYPFRYEDRTRFYSVAEVHESMPFVQVKGKITKMEFIGAARKKRLVANLTDGTGTLELVWFQGINWTREKLIPGVEYVVFGKPNLFGRKISLAHPEVEPLTERLPAGQAGLPAGQAGNEAAGFLQPVYPLTEKLRSKYIDSKLLGKLVAVILKASEKQIRETLPESLIHQYQLIGKVEAINQIHFPESHEKLADAQTRLKFEELFYIQLRLLTLKLVREEKFKGLIFNNAELLTEFYNNHLPFELTNAQKKVIKEIYSDLKSGKQMNRLLQGDVGSGKTIVAFITMLVAIGGEAQTALMAPTEILAIQHFKNIKALADLMKIPVGLLTGSTKKSERNAFHKALQTGYLKILIGTHALIEEEVQFQNLGLAVIDEQHRFGVAQRSKLWTKTKGIYPHVLVMTATPIPRTLAMTLYGDLDISVIDELPAGRKPIKTEHKFDTHRLQVNQFIKNQIAEGRQVYVVYPLIEESEKLDLKHLMDGYESISRAFPDVAISILHGKMPSDAKEFEMTRFKKGETQIMVATTVIEVGVDIPNASVMVIESAERFGLSQLHQLRGRVGRGAKQSYCILMTSYKLSADSKTRMETMVRTNNGFEIAETDLKLRGPGDLMGTQQSGLLDLKIADLVKDTQLLNSARESAKAILKHDPNLISESNRPIRIQIDSLKKNEISWSRIG